MFYSRYLIPEIPPESRVTSHVLTGCSCPGPSLLDLIRDQLELKRAHLDPAVGPLDPDLRDGAARHPPYDLDRRHGLMLTNACRNAHPRPRRRRTRERLQHINSPAWTWWFRVVVVGLPDQIAALAVQGVRHQRAPRR